MNNELKTYILQWINKANEDIFVIERLMEYEIIAKGAVGFHCQQATEKFLKAFLIFHEKEIMKTHNIEFLLEECGKIDSEFLTIDPKNLTDFGVEMRYPGDFYDPSESEVKEYKKIALTIKDLVTTKIKI